MTNRSAWRLPWNGPLIALAACAVAMAGILLYVGRWFTFWWDEWLIIFHRPDLSPTGLLYPFGDTFVAVPVLVYDTRSPCSGSRPTLHSCLCRGPRISRRWPCSIGS